MSGEQEAPLFVPKGYRTVHELGAGQTSRVYLAQHERYGEVALKIPREALAQRPVLRRMFENEVQITIKFDHGNVVRGFAGHPTGPEAFLALEYCAGGTLDQLLLERGRMPIERSLQLVLDVAEGLRYTHDKKVLHRDVKPANVFLDEGGRAKLGDFGTGVYMAEGSDERVGTAFYMAPEIFEGNAPTPRSDIYSLGVLAYEVLTGVRPFLGDSYDALMMAHLTGVPRDPKRYRDDLDHALSKVLLRSLSRDPAKRFETVQEFMSAVRKAAGIEVRETRPAAGAEPSVGRRSRKHGAGAAEGRGDAPEGEDEGKRKGFLQRLFGFGRD